MTWKWRQNGVAYPYMGTSRHFHVVFDVRVFDLNLSNDSLVVNSVWSQLDKIVMEIYSQILQIDNLFYCHIEGKSKYEVCFITNILVVRGVSEIDATLKEWSRV